MLFYDKLSTALFLDFKSTKKEKSLEFFKSHCSKTRKIKVYEKKYIK